MNLIKKKLKNLFFRHGKRISSWLELHLTWGVSTREVKSFLRKLHPIDPKIELIRGGPKGDGGYLLPDDLIGISACFSPGIDLESRFELELAEKGMTVYMADFSVEKPMLDHPNFHFTKKFVGADDRGNFMTMDTWVAASLPQADQSDLLLQMDIESYEYEAILSMSRPLLNRFRIIVIELHLLDQIFNRFFFNQLNRVFEKLLLNHTVVHLHPNNHDKSVFVNGTEIPPLMEITLLRNDRFSSSEYFSNYPHPLDATNVPGSTLDLPKDWYRRS